MSVETLSRSELGARGLAATEAIERFEEVYRAAAGDPTRVRWHSEGPTPAVVAWLNVEASALVRPGATAAVVGCGLGDDVAELCCRGYDVVGFDAAPTAVSWAKERHPHISDRFLRADLLDLPLRMLRRYDLVVEAFTLEWLSPIERERAAAAIASLARPHGTVLAVSHGRSDDALDAPEGGQSLTPIEMTTLFAAADMHTTRAIDDFTDDGDVPTRFLRGVFHH